MKKTIYISLIIAIAIVGIIGLATLSDSEPQTVRDGTTPHVLVHKEATCGCCSVYTKYLKRHPYTVEARNTRELGSIKERLGVPDELYSCHTMEVDGYIVEGHIPQEAIEKLLTEQPDIHGIGMAGMPAGSPGMPGPQVEEFTIYTIPEPHVKGDPFMML